MRRLLKASLGFAVVCAAQPIMAQDEGVDRSQIFAAFEAHGYTLEAPEGDDNTRESTMQLPGGENVNFVVRGYGCEGGRGCDAAVMFVNFDLGREIGAREREAIGDYNDSRPFGRAYGFDNYVGVDSVVALGGTGDIGYLQRRIRDFPAVVQTFLSHMQENRSD